jgi:hypothetical protein
VDGSASGAATLAAFFFFADLDSDLTCGFWVAGAAILKVGLRIGVVVKSVGACVWNSVEAVRDRVFDVVCDNVLSRDILDDTKGNGFRNLG